VISDARTQFSCSNAHVRTLAVSNLKVLCSQFPFVVAAGAVAEELFFRVSIQVCYTDINLRTSSSVSSESKLVSLCQTLISS